jgi:hypothetical protein
LGHGSSANPCHFSNGSTKRGKNLASNLPRLGRARHRNILKPSKDSRLIVWKAPKDLGEPLACDGGFGSNIGGRQPWVPIWGSKATPIHTKERRPAIRTLRGNSFTSADIANDVYFL